MEKVLITIENKLIETTRKKANELHDKITKDPENKDEYLTDFEIHNTILGYIHSTYNY